MLARYFSELQALVSFQILYFIFQFCVENGGYLAEFDSQSDDQKLDFYLDQKTYYWIGLKAPSKSGKLSLTVQRYFYNIDVDIEIECCFHRFYLKNREQKIDKINKITRYRSKVGKHLYCVANCRKICLGKKWESTFLYKLVDI